jgi:hypothetical protein
MYNGEKKEKKRKEKKRKEKHKPSLAGRLKIDEKKKRGEDGRQSTYPGRSMEYGPRLSTPSLLSNTRSHAQSGGGGRLSASFQLG